MSEIITERSGSILRVQLNRPAKKNAMTSSMYTTLADLLNSTAKDDRICVVLWHGAGDSFCAGNDVEDFVIGDASHARRETAGHGDGNCAEVGRETGWRATGLQETHEAVFTRADRAGDESRERGVRLARALGGHQGSDDGVP
jgi:enoyl-CoA hydratase/carnithine racemase